MNIYQSNCFRKDLGWLHFYNDPRVQEREQVLDEQSYIPVFAAYLTYQSSSKEHQRRHDNSIPYKAVWEIYRDKSNLRRKKLHTTFQGSNCLGYSLYNGNNARALIQFWRRQSQHLKRRFFSKNRPIYFHISCTRVIRLVKLNKLSFSSIQIKPRPTPIHSFP